MIDPSDVELAAMRECLKAFGEAAGEIGFDKPLGALCRKPRRCASSMPSSRCYTEAMAEHHEATVPAGARHGSRRPIRSGFPDLE